MRRLGLSQGHPEPFKHDIHYSHRSGFMEGREWSLFIYYLEITLDAPLRTQHRVSTPEKWMARCWGPLSIFYRMAIPHHLLAGPHISERPANDLYSFRRSEELRRNNLKLEPYN